MKKSLSYILMSAGLILAACNGIAEDDRYIEVESTKAERTVLLEDFTGQNCVNCPAAHRTIEALEEQYGSHLIAVSIHAGHFGIPATNKRYTGLMQEEGQAYNDRYGIEDYPKGVIDGKRPPVNADQWASDIFNEISIPTPLTVGVEAALSADGKTIDISCSLKSSEQLSGNLVVWVIESSIIARQEDLNEGRINDYVHNNVFRACVNGLDGDAVTLSADTPETKTYSIAVKDTDTEKWAPENLAIVAFVSNSSGVQQAAKSNVITNK
ncbi:MAG: Omp28 family outer membrane lipoprotein [Muribaculaceae bacterium]|nr:Omp28 family outer membrane lipoprotein [Muribaculaceae bacterium]